MTDGPRAFDAEERAANIEAKPEGEKAMKPKTIRIFCYSLKCNGHRATFDELEQERQAGRPYVYNKLESQRELDEARAARRATGTR